MFYFANDEKITVYFANGDIAEWTKAKTNPNMYNTILKQAQEGNFVRIEKLKNLKKALIEFDVEITDNSVSIKTPEDERIELEGKLKDFIQLLREKGVISSKIERIKPFLIKMFQNKYIDCVEELYDFCSNMDFEITEDGNFLAYKKVNKNFTSCHDGVTRHDVGKVVEVSDFCTDRNITCAEGLHFCSKGYLQGYMGDTTLVVEVDPRDVVSIPVDYNNQKGRCRRYKVIGVLGNDGSLNTTNIEAMTNNEVKVVKTEKKAQEDKSEAKIKGGTRIQQTVSLMEIHKDADKVAEIMGISRSTVRRNLLKAKGH